MASKNLGQVSGVYVGNTPPTNTILIWYDNTPTQQRHKVYDPRLMQWVVLDQSVISAITYSELTNTARRAGLSAGQYFQITDRNNILALAITSTKVQYCDNLGNLLIDDLGVNIQYHVTSSNLQIDDVVGVFDTVNKRLVFRFDEQTPALSDDNYILGKVRINNVWSLVKYKIQSFLSRVTGNSITWNGGFFFSFSEALKGIVDKTGGVVGKATYDSDKERLITSINNVGKENQSIIQNAHNEIVEATKPEAIYRSRMPSQPETDGEPTDVQEGDTLSSIISKLQGYINKFKRATGIRISQDFTDSVTPSYVNNNDTVDSAIRKLQRMIKNVDVGSGSLPSDWAAGNTADDNVIAAGDSFVNAFSKIAGKFDQIGQISDGKIVATVSSSTSGYTKTTTFATYDGQLKFEDASRSSFISAELNRDTGLTFSNNHVGMVQISAKEGVLIDMQERQKFDIPEYDKEGGIYSGGVAAVTIKSKGVTNTDEEKLKYYAALSARCNKSNIDNVKAYLFDAYFARLKVGGLSLGSTLLMDESFIYPTREVSQIVIMPNSSTSVRTIVLPSYADKGHTIFIVSFNNTQTVQLAANGGSIVTNRLIQSTSASNAVIELPTGFNICMVMCVSSTIGSMSERIWMITKTVW